MQNGHINTQRILPIHQVYSVCVADVRRCSIGALLLRLMNAKLTMLFVRLSPPPSTKNKYYISQDGIDFKDVLSLLCPRASSFCTGCRQGLLRMLRQHARARFASFFGNLLLKISAFFRVCLAARVSIFSSCLTARVTRYRLNACGVTLLTTESERIECPDN